MLGTLKSVIVLRVTIAEKSIHALLVMFSPTWTDTLSYDR